jgi:hypothetical protein
LASGRSDDRVVAIRSQLCRAIHARTLLEFEYEGHQRVVAPYCYGATNKGIEVLRAIQMGGSSRSGGFGFGKLWHVAKMKNLHNTDERFVATDPAYNPDDRAMARIYCRI